MKIVLLTPWISPHQLPLANECAALVGESEFCYLYLEDPLPGHIVWGWDKLGKEVWCRKGTLNDKVLLDADVVVSGVRIPWLFRARAGRGKKTFYMSERWFKPPIGMFRILHPGYLRMVWQMCRCMKDEILTGLPMSIHSARDLLRIYGLLSGDVRCLFRPPQVAFESRPGGVIVSLEEAINAGVLSKEEVEFGKKNGFVQIPERHWGTLKPCGAYDKVRIWGYFVAPGGKEIKNCELRIKNGAECRDSEDVVKIDKKLDKRDILKDALPIQHPTTNSVKVLWVGRMLDWKCVDVLVRAVSPHPDCKCADVSLNIYGKGETEAAVRKEAEGADNISFHDFVPISEVRKLMRKHDVYVLCSNGYEGWGAVVSEALEEGMKVLGTIEAGSTATILPPGNLFKAGDVNRLREMLFNDVSNVGIGKWTAKYAASALLQMCK